MNVKTTGEAFVHINVLHNNFPVNPNVMNGTFALPVTPSEIRLHCILTAVHEGCHMLGLVANNNVLGGDADKHNPVPNGTRVMDDGKIVPYEIRFGRAGPWWWLPLNGAYLKFVFPKE